MIKGKMGFTTCFDRQAGEVSKFSAYGMFSDFLFQTTTYAVRGEAYGSSKMTTYNVRGEASKGLIDTTSPSEFFPMEVRGFSILSKHDNMRLQENTRTWTLGFNAWWSSDPKRLLNNMRA